MVTAVTGSHLELLWAMRCYGLLPLPDVAPGSLRVDGQHTAAMTPGVFRAAAAGACGVSACTLWCCRWIALAGDCGLVPAVWKALSGAGCKLAGKVYCAGVLRSCVDLVARGA